MEISLSSSSLSIKEFHSFPPAKSLRKSWKFSSISCRAAYNDTNFYKVLSLSSSNASIEEIKRAYRTLVLKYHPDVCPPSTKEECTKMFVLLHAAYKTLSDPLLREEYNYGMGLSKFESRAHIGSGRWEDQVLELGKKSNERAAQKDGSWGARLRAKNGQNCVM